MQATHLKMPNLVREYGGGELDAAMGGRVRASIRATLVSTLVSTHQLFSPTSPSVHTETL